ncbi:MAG: hypothetical protein MUF64_23355 [Polyangiaceae bacterium]|jgi:hypothetical protein|nr:hypothetical protein [Polyangiaceae bacterium]
MTVRRTGDWDRARSLLAAGPARLRGALGALLEQEARSLQGQIVEGLKNQAPGGKALPPLAATTLAARRMVGAGGSKALLRRGTLPEAIVVRLSGLEAFVGVSGGASAGGGKSAADLAKLHEFGAGPFVVRLSPKARRFLFAMLRQSGQERGGSEGGGRGVAVIRIPPRPFLRPAFEAYRKGIRGRIALQVARLLGWGG